MTSVSDIITAAYREGNLIPAGKEPTNAEKTEALGLLNRFMASQPGRAFGEKLADWDVPEKLHTSPFSTNFPQLPTIPDVPGIDAGYVTPYPPKNSRVIWGGVDATVYLPQAPDDGSRFAVSQGSTAATKGGAGAVLTLDGNGRRIDAADSLLLAYPLDAAEWHYRADLAEWKKVTPLKELTDELVYTPDIDDYWIIWLAIRLAPRYDKQINSATAEQLKAMEGIVRSRYTQHQDTTFGSKHIPNTAQSYRRGTGNGWV